MATETWADEGSTSINEYANQIWASANKLRGVYQKKDNGNVVLPMVVLRRFECVLEATKDAVVAAFEDDPDLPPEVLCSISGYDFYNTSRFTLSELLNDADNLAENFKAYIDGFSQNVKDILDGGGLKIEGEIDKMDKGGCLYAIVKQYSEMDLSEQTVPSVLMGHIFENLIRRSFVEEGQGEDFTARDIIKLNVSLVTAEGCDDIYKPGRIVTVFDQAAGTGGMLFTAAELLQNLNADMDVRLYGQEFNDVTYAVGKAEMLIKHQDASNFVHTDTFKDDCFPDVKARFVLENPPFGTPWKGDDAKDGQREAVEEEYKKGMDGRWGAGLPDGGDAQLIFLQSAVAKLADNGRAGIISDGTPLTAGSVSNGSLQVRRWLLENDLLDAIVKLPTDMFYDTGITTYIWVIAKRKSPERTGKVQLIDASTFCTKMRKPMGSKRNEITAEDRQAVVRIYTDFEESEHSKIFPTSEFIYQEWTVYRPLQERYQVTQETCERVMADRMFAYDPEREQELADKESRTAKEEKELAKLLKTHALADAVGGALRAHMDSEAFMDPEGAKAFVHKMLGGLDVDAKAEKRVLELIGTHDLSAPVQHDRRGNVVWDRDKDKELVRLDQDVDEYMEREVVPYVPGAKWVLEEKPDAKRPVVKTGAEIPFTRYFYKYVKPRPSEELAAELAEIEAGLDKDMARLFGGDAR